MPVKLICRNLYPAKCLNVYQLTRNTTKKCLYSTVVQNVDAKPIKTATADAEWEKAKPFHEIPGYSKWQILRGFLPGGKFHNIDLNKLFKTINKDYGDFVRFPGFFGNPDMLMTFKPEFFEIIFRNEGPWPFRRGFETIDYHRKKHRANYFDGVSGILTSNGEEWAKFRSIVNPVLMQPKTIHNYLNRMSAVSDEFIERIKAIRNEETKEVPDNFLQFINRWTLESVMVVALDKHLGLLRGEQNQAEDVLKFFKNINNVFHLSAKLEIEPPLWKIIKTPTFNKMMNTLDNIISFVDKYTQEAIDRLEKEKSEGIERSQAEQSVLERLIKIDPKIASVMAMDMLFAGVDTTASTFTGIMLGLSKNPAAQEKAREEVMRILPNKDSILTEEKMKNLPYLRACFKEAQRLYPLGPGVIRGATKDFVLNGYRIPKGIDISIGNLFILLDPDYFPRPLEFLPERWLRTDEKSAELIGKKQHPFTYFPFGFGPRSCVGKRIVSLELEIGLCKILRNFQFEFNYTTDDVFKNTLINLPVKPLKFTFKDL